MVELLESVRTRVEPDISVEVVFRSLVTTFVIPLDMLDAMVRSVEFLFRCTEVTAMAIMLAITPSISFGEVGVDMPDSGLANSSAYVFSVSVSG